MYVDPKTFGEHLKPPISSRRVQTLCQEGRSEGAQKLGKSIKSSWMIPENSPDPRKPRGWQKGVSRSKESNNQN